MTIIDLFSFFAVTFLWLNEIGTVISAFSLSSSFCWLGSVQRQSNYYNYHHNFGQRLLLSKTVTRSRRSNIMGMTRAAPEEPAVFSTVEEGNQLLWDWATHTNSSFHYFTNEEAYEIQSALLTWYQKNRRKLPWRGDPPPYDGSTAGINSNNSSNGNSGKRAKKDSSQPNIHSFFQPLTKKEDQDEGITKQENDNTSHEVTAYGVWVSEIMCQQTRVEAVIPYYLKWMKSFPTVYDLANATEEEVNSHWAGLGFYRRARMLHAGAKYVVTEHNGIVPNTVEELLKIDGVGRYTACAIASMAYNVSVPVVDGNVCRVLSRLKGIANHIKSPTLKDKYAWDLAQQLVESPTSKNKKIKSNINAGLINQALMELGATYCAPSGTGIHPKDPLKPFYMSTKLGQQLHYTLTKTDTTLEEFISHAKAVRSRKKCALCSQDSNDDNIISTVLYQINDNLQTQNENNQNGDGKVGNKHEIAATCGHAAFPIPPPKKAKREEILAVATIVCDDHWLMIKRPKDGLLAGQWEFPSVCVWNSATDGKRKSKKVSEVVLPSIEPKVRTKAMNQFLTKNILLSSSDDSYEMKEEAVNLISSIMKKKRQLINKDVALEHIFSHVRHSMWIEHLDASSMTNFDCKSSITDFLLNDTKDGREVRWMSESDMKDVGITSGVKKIFSLVKKKQTKINTLQSPRKRIKTEE